MKKLLLLVSLLMISTATFADSTITSTDFAKAYKDIPIVAKMLETNGECVTEELIDYLADENNPIDVKIAAINAVSIYKDVYTPLMAKLKSKWCTDSEITVLKEIDASTHTALAYANARSNWNWLDLREAIILTYSAFTKDPHSFTVNMVYALIISTHIMEDGTFCDVFKICDSVIVDNSLKQDMRQEAIGMMFEYINLYKDDCE